MIELLLGYALGLLTIPAITVVGVLAGTAGVRIGNNPWVGMDPDKDDERGPE